MIDERDARYPLTIDPIAQQAYLKASTKGSDPDRFNEFGISAAVSGDTVVVGAVYESSNATGRNGNQGNNSALYTGAAYVFTGLGIGPQLAVVRDGTSIQISWPASVTGSVFQSATMLTHDGDWQDFPTPPTEINGQNRVTINPTASVGFFRLREL